MQPERDLITRASFQEAQRRIVYRLIVSEYRSNPALFEKYPPAAVHSLGERYRKFFPSLYPWFGYYARNMAHGLKLAYLRDQPIENTLRAIHKRRPHCVH